MKETELAYLLDGLSAEREQGITIDVAHRYFETQRRKYTIMDCPGHVQYTRNMVTGASTADCAIVIMDARKGLLTQSKRHGFILSLLQIPHLIVAVNKMDLVGYSQNVYSDVIEAYKEFSQKLVLNDITFIPVSALKGDNIVYQTRIMPWYEGPTLLHLLENLHISSNRNLVDFRFPVQYVIRPNQDFRGFAGKIISGTISPGEEIAVLPSGLTSKIKSIHTYDGDLQEAFAPQSVVITLMDDIDVSRGDMIVRTKNLPQEGKKIEATICWMDETPSSTITSYILKHTSRHVRASINNIVYKIDVETLHREKAGAFRLNEMGKVDISLSEPIFFDPYRINRQTGAFILIDPATNNTVAAGMIKDKVKELKDLQCPEIRSLKKYVSSSSTVWKGWNIPRALREERIGHKAAVLWFTGLSGAGKTTIAGALEKRLFAAGCQTMFLDGDNMRFGLCSDLGFSETDRHENIRRIGEVAKLFFETGHIVLCSFISPFLKDRQFVRSIIAEKRFFEIYVKCSLETCIRRDPTGLYKKALIGVVREFTGISSPYEIPPAPEITLDTDSIDIDHGMELVMRELISENVIPG